MAPLVGGFCVAFPKESIDRLIPRKTISSGTKKRLRKNFRFWPLRPLPRVVQWHRMVPWVLRPGPESFHPPLPAARRLTGQRGGVAMRRARAWGADVLWGRAPPPGPNVSLHAQGHMVFACTAARNPPQRHRLLVVLSPLAIACLEGGGWGPPRDWYTTRGSSYQPQQLNTRNFRKQTNVLNVVTIQPTKSHIYMS